MAVENYVHCKSDLTLNKNVYYNAGTHSRTKMTVEC